MTLDDANCRNWPRFVLVHRPGNRTFSWTDERRVASALTGRWRWRCQATSRRVGCSSSTHYTPAPHTHTHTHTHTALLTTSSPTSQLPLIALLCSSAVLDPRLGHTMHVLSPFFCHSDWLFHGESCPRLDAVHPGRAWPSSPACTWHCSLHYLILHATPLFPHGYIYIWVVLTLPK